MLCPPPLLSPWADRFSLHRPPALYHLPSPRMYDTSELRSAVNSRVDRQQHCIVHFRNCACSELAVRTKNHDCWTPKFSRTWGRKLGSAIRVFQVGDYPGIVAAKYPTITTHIHFLKIFIFFRVGKFYLPKTLIFNFGKYQWRIKRAFEFPDKYKYPCTEK